MKSKKLKMMTCALSVAVLTVVGGGVASISQNGGQGVEVQAATTKKSEAQLRKIVLGKWPGKVVRYYAEWDDGRREHHYTIKQNNGTIVEVEILDSGYITDVDYEGHVGPNGTWYDDDYYDDDYYDWD